MSVRTRVKICGLSDGDSARVAAEAGADAVGLVFFEKSARCVDLVAARTVITALPAFVEPVALFVNASADRIRRTTEALGISTVQLHGLETPEEAAALSPLRVIKSISVTEDAAGAIAPWREAPPNVAGLLYDAPPTPEGVPGGTGRSFDWRALAELDRGSLPATIVAGGLTPENVARAVGLIRPWAVDVSSGVESSRGVKDAGKIRAFVEAVRNADEARVSA